MIIRLSQKLTKKLKVGTLPSLPLDENPYADWSAHLFTADRTQYIILTNTQSLYSVVMYGKGAADDSRFIGRALDNIRAFMEDDGQAFVYQRFVAPASGSVTFAKALNRSVTGSMNDMIVHAKHWLSEREASPFQVGFKLNEIPMSALGAPRDYQRPREAFKLLSERNEASESSAAPSEPTESRQLHSETLDTESEANTLSGPTISVPFTFAQRKAIAEILPEMAHRLKLDEKPARAILFTAGELETIRQRTRDAIATAQNGMKRNSLRHTVARASKAIDESQGVESIPASARLYQFKITLLESDPPIWRRIQIKNCTLDKLHGHIQTSMGWTNSHLHQFEIDDVIYGDPELLSEGWNDETLPVDSLNTRISKIIPKDGNRYSFRYQYDFGDSWEHAVLFEGCLRAEKGKRYPLCVEGERACPPEDVGGIWGFANFLQTLADPDHEQHDEYMEWAGPFDPEEFDANKATNAMRRGLQDWRQDL